MSVRPVLRSRTVPGLTALIAVATLTLSACSGDSDEPEKDAAPQTVQVTLTGDEISPKGERVKVGAGETLKVEITADHEGELHVHSDPEQSLEYVDGTVTREVTIDRPGVVEVESHDPSLVILQLEVR